jgi:hypothetical protein
MLYSLFLFFISALWLISSIRNREIRTGKSVMRKRDYPVAFRFFVSLMGLATLVFAMVSMLAISNALERSREEPYKPKTFEELKEEADPKGSRRRWSERAVDCLTLPPTYRRVFPAEFLKLSSS